MNGGRREALLLDIATLRSGSLDAVLSTLPITNRIDRFCDCLRAWSNLTDAARQSYGRIVIECLFDLASDVEDDTRLGAAAELSLWQAAIDLGLHEFDQGRGEYMLRRAHRLEGSLESAAESGAERLLYQWSRLLRPRPEKIRRLPGPFREDIAAVVTELVHAGLPRRARALSNKFQLPLDPFLRWTIDHRPESEEIGKTRDLSERVAAPLRLVPYRVFVRSRSLQRVLDAPIGSMPMAVGASGCITIGRETYGAC